MASRPRTATQAMRTEQHALAVHIIAALTRHAQADERVRQFLALETTSKAITAMLDDYKPLVDLNVIEDELSVLPERLRTLESRGQIPRAMADNVIGRIQRALRETRGYPR